MTAIDGALLDFKLMDRLAAGDSALHRLDPRAKVLATFIFICTVVSFDRYAVTAMIPFAVFPVAMAAAGDLPPRYILKKIVLICPFALVVGMFNPLFDRTVIAHFGPVDITGGWLSFASIVVRAMLTVGAGITLVGVTGFPAICQALERLGAPQTFAVQLLFLYRYLYLLADEVGRVSRARELRSFGRKGLGVAPFGSLVGHLLLRTWRRAEGICMAMLARGFSGEFPTRQTFRFGLRELAFLAGWTGLFVTLRLLNISQLLGDLVTAAFA